MALLKTHTLISSQSITSTSNSSTFTLSPGDKKWAALLSVGNITGTSPTLDVTIKHSADGSNWVTLRSFTQLTGASANTTVHVFASSATDYLNPLLPFVRAEWTIGGSDTPTFSSLTLKLLVGE